MIISFVLYQRGQHSSNQGYTFEVTGYIAPSDTALATTLKSSSTLNPSLLTTNISKVNTLSTDTLSTDTLSTDTLSETMSEIQDEVEDLTESKKEISVQVVDDALFKVSESRAYQEATLENKRVFAERVLRYLETEGLVQNIRFNESNDTLLFEYANESNGYFEIERIYSTESK